MKILRVLSIFILAFVTLSSAKAIGSGFRFEEHPDLDDENFPFRLIPEQHQISKRQATAADDTFNTAQTVMNVTKAYMVREWEIVSKFNRSIVEIIVDQQELLRNYIKEDHSIDMTGVPGTQLTDVVKEKTDNQTALLEIETKAAELIVEMCERILKLIGTPTILKLVPPIDGLDPEIRDGVVNVICNANSFFFKLCSSNDETTRPTTEAPVVVDLGVLRNPDSLASDRVDTSLPSASDFADQSSASSSNPDEESSNPSDSSSSNPAQSSDLTSSNSEARPTSSTSNPDDSQASISNSDQSSDSSSSNPDELFSSSNPDESPDSLSSTPDESDSSSSNPDEPPNPSDSSPFSSSSGLDESDDDFMSDPTPSDQSSTIEEDVLEAPDTASDRSDTNHGEALEYEEEDHDHEDQGDHEHNEVQDGKTSAVTDENGATAISASISVILLAFLAISASLCL